MKSKGLKVLVTGGAGYIGSHTVVELYAAGYVPVILDNFERSNPSVAEAIHAITGQSPTTYQIDCRDAEGLDKVFQAEGGFAAVIHFAAYKAVGESVAFPAKYHDNNIGGLAVVLQAMERNGNPPLVFSSSCTVYGQPEILPVTESSPLLPANSPYGYTKQVCEEMINQAVVAQMQLRAVTLRYFNPIGAHPSALLGEQPIGVPNNLVPFITQAAVGLRPPVTIFGNDYPTPDGTNIRDYLHVVDLAKAHVAALDLVVGANGGGFNRIFNLGSGKGHSVLEVVNAMEEVLGHPLAYQIGPRRAGDVAAIWAESNSSLPGWEPKLGLVEALRDAWRWQQRISGKSTHTDAAQ